MIRYGMVGGGDGSFIGEVHRKAAAFDRMAVLTAGCFSRDAARSVHAGRRFGLPPDRIYSNYTEMAEQEASRPDGIQFVSIATPNSTHYDAARTFLEQGIHVVCDKPLALEEGEAEELKELADRRQLLCCVTYTYSGYPFVKQARTFIRQGGLGELYMVMAEYPQEWMLDVEGPTWRDDPHIQGSSGCVADIGVHIEHTVSYMTGLQLEALSARLDSVGPSARLDNNAAISVRYTNGASGLYWCSQVARGCRNGLKVRVFGTKGSLEWEQENPDALRLALSGCPVQQLSRGRDTLAPLDKMFQRLPGGHPEGVYEAFANLYTAFCSVLSRRLAGAAMPDDGDYPRIEDGLRGVRFVGKCLESARDGAKWVSIR